MGSVINGMGRVEKWAYKTDPDLIYPILKAGHDISVSLIKKTYDTIDRYYEDTSRILDNHSIIASFRLMYRSYMEELYRIFTTYDHDAALSKASALSAKYMLYNLDINILREIAQLFGLEALVGLEDIIKEGLAPLIPSSIEGTIVADGTEQNILVDSDTDVHWWEGFIDLSALDDGEQVWMKEYVSVVKPVSYNRYHDEIYTGILTNPVIYIVTKPAKFGLMITIQQLNGTMRSFPFQLFKRMMA
jgi:hypothetical protein